MKGLLLSVCLSINILAQSSIVIDAGASINLGEGTDIGVNSISGTVTGSGTINGLPIPVELISFTAIVEQRNVRLNWSTATELNNSGFEIERTAIGGDNTELWIKIEFVKGAGTSTKIQEYTYTDKDLNTGKYKYRLKQIDFGGRFEYFYLSSEVEIGVPDSYSLSQNYPNPFNPTTRIDYQLPLDSKIIIELFRISGEKKAELINGFQKSGFYSIEINADILNLSSGVYIYRLSASGYSVKENFVSLKKMLIIK